MTKLVLSHLIEYEMFSLCLASKGGFLNLGKASFSLKSSEMILNNMIGAGYNLNITKIRLGKFETSTGYTALIDSGTVNTILPKKIADELESAFKDLAKKNKVLFYTNKSKKLCFSKHLVLPPLEFELEKGKFNWDSASYLKRSDKDYCLRVTKSNDDKIILGNSWMTNKEVTFNIADKTIGIEYVDCSKGKGLVVESKSPLHENAYWLYLTFGISFSITVVVLNVCFGEEKDW